MILHREHLGRHPSVFRSMTGLTVAAFDQLLPELRAAFAADRRRRRPLWEQSGKDTMRLPDPGKGRRRDLPALLQETPDLAVIVDTFEQRTQRPQRRQRAYDSGKKKAHTLKSQVAVDEDGRIVDVTITNTVGTSAAGAADHFTYVATATSPTVVGVNPNSGPLGVGLWWTSPAPTS